MLDAIARQCERTQISFLWRPTLPDPADEMVLETAINGRASWIITFNLNDYAGAEAFGVNVGRPGPALAYLSQERT